MVKGKRGWIRIMEAVLAVMLLAGFLTYIIVSQSTKPNLENVAYNIEASILRDVAKDDNLRNDILVGSCNLVNEYIRERLPETFNFSTRVCAMGDVCGCLDCPLDRDVYADSTPIFSTLSSYDPKQFKMFIWRK